MHKLACLREGTAARTDSVRGLNGPVGRRLAGITQGVVRRSSVRRASGPMTPRHIGRGLVRRVSGPRIPRRIGRDFGHRMIWFLANGRLSSMADLVRIQVWGPNAFPNGGVSR